MIARTSFRALCLLAATLAPACGSSDSDDKTICQAGQQASCACPGGGQGAQVCRSDGSGWDACQGCSGGGGSGGGGATCTNIAGTWTITSHCQTSQVGSTVTVHQTECVIDDVQPWTGWKGTADSNGVSLSGPAGSSNMTCNGSVVGGVLAMECTPPCSVKLTKN